MFVKVSQSLKINKSKNPTTNSLKGCLDRETEYLQSTVKCLKSLCSKFALVRTCNAIFALILCLTLLYSFVNNLKKKNISEFKIHMTPFFLSLQTPCHLLPLPSLPTPALQHILQGRIKLLLPTLPSPTIYVPFFP